MGEPSASKYPTAYDDNDSLLVALTNRAVFRLEYAVGVEDLQFTVTETIGLSAPMYITFAGGEIAFIETVNDDTFICTDLDCRGVLNSPLQPHGKNEKIYVGIVSPYLKLLKLAIQAAQKFQGRVGLDASKGTPSYAGERYTATDTKKAYISFNGSSWTWVNKVSHGDLDGLTDDDHDDITNGYHTNDRATTWHGNLGTFHIDGGDDHDHLTADQGLAVRRVDGGAETSRPETPGYERQTWFSTDLDGGTLFIAKDANTWTKISGVPTGAILAFDGDCPTGFTRVATLNDKYLYGADTAGDTGGNTNHQHDYDEIQEHYHSIPEDSTTSGDEGNHSHWFKYKTNSGTGYTVGALCSGGTTRTTSPSGAHGHDATVDATTTGSTGSASGQTSSTDNQPASREVTWCKKD